MKKTIIFSTLLSLILISCEEETHPTHMQIHFSHTIDNVSLVCGSGCINGGECLPDHSCCMGGKLLPYTNAIGQQYNVERLNYLISDIKLHSESGNEILIKEVHFIDLDDRSTLYIDTENIKNDSYTSISFTMGLDTSKNISNLYVNESFHTSMAWPDMMGGGYHYMKLEGDYDTITNGYATHTGGSMGSDFSFNKTFNIDLVTTDQTQQAQIQINMDINKWYQNPNNINIEPAIMANMNKQLDLKENGLQDVFSVTSTIDR